MDAPLEIELKLALPPEQTSAFVRRMARRRSVPRERDLVTLYFDTPDFALSAAGVALRLRRSGRRWVQTLKTEGERAGGLSRRLEFEMPVDRGALDWTRFPPAAAACVPEPLRAVLIPVFETRFRRTTWEVSGRGGARVEVALDVGEIRAGKRRAPLCEIELELLAGNPDALFALALNWAGALDCLPLDVSKAERGARLARGALAEAVKASSPSLAAAMSVEAGFAAIMQACLAHFQANLPGILHTPLQAGPAAGGGPPPDDDTIACVHQARVALRRLRVALRLFRGICELPQVLRRTLRTLTAALGPARDWDVLVEKTLPAIGQHHPDAARWEAAMLALRTRRDQVRATMRADLLNARPGAWLLEMQRWLLRHGWRQAAGAERRRAQASPLDTWARDALRRGHRRLVRGMRGFARLSPARRHALRIEVKRQRHAVEFLRDLFPAPLEAARQARYLAALRRVQDSLGRSNDAYTAWELLRCAPADGPGDFALGWLAAQRAFAGVDDDAALVADFLDAPPFWADAQTS